jgi:hypothetical protein
VRVIGGGARGLLTFLELPACDVALGHGGRQGGHGEVLRSTVGRGDTESCIAYGLDEHREGLVAGEQRGPGTHDGGHVCRRRQ